VATGRAQTAVALASSPDAPLDTVVTPQWRVIERVTIGQVLLAGGEAAGAAEALSEAVASAEAHRLPHQIQRVVRVAKAANDERGSEVVESGTAALERLRRTLTLPG
jgi:hypothetical protein